jgi:hypothetical protein
MASEIKRAPLYFMLPPHIHACLRKRCAVLRRAVPALPFSILAHRLKLEIRGSCDEKCGELGELGTVGETGEVP